ncbi:type II toxin-antitoxin system VapC family toxin [Paludibaculum fermentans]|uniref:Ribonuclease VapC n=1 Tax=Paludibaculum fermentans TaxID=1473598 RepID=A0A7S7NM40_PALFE|nr:PIN domain-containing protein [Paludibaculum fermentans]QOY86120.1 PIN domain-containing protein [Paludibaculum fermentans]
MVLVDTSVWIQHLRAGEPKLSALLADGLVVMHPFVLGELACGNLKDRATILSSLGSLPAAQLATHAEVLWLIEDSKLSGRGLGWTDVHLLASSLLSPCEFWTLDKRLFAAASELGLTR